MKGKEAIHFYFGSNSRVTTECPGAPCSIGCYEWSDGRLACQYQTTSAVEESRFHELQQEYNRLCGREGIDEKSMLCLLLEIIQAYNDEYNRTTEKDKEIPLTDYRFFVHCILELQKRGKELPASLRAELYREAGMFEKCFEFSSSACSSRDEMEIVDEVLFRAAHGDSKPFIIEQCDYYSNNPRPVKRFPCPNSSM